MKHISLPLASVAVALVIAMGIAPAWAYFTDSSTASGTLTLDSPKFVPDIKEWYGQRVKHVVITNSDEATMPIYVRVRVYVPQALTAKIAGTNWTGPVDEWYEYSEIVAPGGATGELTVELTFPPVQSPEAPKGAVVGDNYNVVVVYQATPVLYKSDGTPYADWSYTLDSGTTGGGE